MNKLILSLGMGLAIATIVESSEYREFTNQDGKTLVARAIKYDTEEGKVQLELKNRRKAWLELSLLSEVDQNYVRQWALVDQFMSSVKFKIDGKYDESPLVSVTEQIGSDEIKLGEKVEIVYEIMLDNRTDFTIKNLKIEYRGFVLDKNLELREDSSRVDGGEVLLDEIPAGDRVFITLNPLMIVTRYEMIKEQSGNHVVRYSKKKNVESLKGFWIKVYGPELNGSPSIREWSYPSDFRENTIWKNNIRHAPPIVSTLAGNNRPSDSIIEQLTKADALKEIDPEQALSIYQKIYNSSASMDAAVGIGELYLYYLDSKDIPLGLEWLEKAAAHKHYRACYLLMQFFDSKGDAQYQNLNRAIEFSRQLVSINPSWGQHTVLAELYARSGQFNMAEEHQKIAIELHEKTRDQKNGGSDESRLKETLRRYQNKQC